MKQKQINKNKEKEKRRDHKGTLVPLICIVII
jgi:hypothetical protein